MGRDGELRCPFGSHESVSDRISGTRHRVISIGSG